MSTAGGPKLAGIGRSGDSDIVLCMDAHDAGSYPGEPTTNDNPFTLSDSATDGSGQGSVGTRTLITDNHVRIVDVASNTRQTHLIQGLTASTTYTISTLYKKLSGTPTFRYQIQAHSGASYLRTLKFTNTAETGIEDKEGWQLASWTFVLSSDANAVRIWYQDGADYTTYTHSFELKNPQLEAKAYATPFVREPWNYFGGGNARPASVNLMIHGDVGTGTSFEDSSPSKHTITTVGNTTHSSAESKFSGGSVYFDGTGDKLTLASSTDWAVGATATIDCWVYPTDAYTTNHRLWSVVNNSSNLDGYIDSNGYFYMHGGIIQANTQTVPRNVWTHIAVTYNSGAVKIYFNGASQSLAGTTTGYNISNTGTLHIGNFSSGSYYYAGYMDEMRITKGTALWTSAFTPPTRRNRNAPLVDLSGSDNGGNFATKDMTDVATYRDGQVIEPVASAVWDFDGTDDVIDLGNINYNGLTGLTVATWVYSSNFAANDSFLSSWGDNAYSNYGWLLFASQWVSTKIDWLISTNGTSYTRCAGTLGLTNNLWYHIVGTWNSSGAMVLYINGALDGTATGPASIMNNDFNTFIGCDSDGGSESKVRFFGGQMGNATIWKTTLTDQQVKQNFNSQRSRFQV